ncbi:hypothetical protein SVI_1695 [Shewanella violacea DSS12]|uniref:Uncharacterized protein n=1 Tax=Shewanella violacea (strain JCM 10179 / CIP 106290 / LMG 19151 / DSS12) TaxID=637905 RepID=D4ZJ17_SHEVD|nr:hypothetical protein SVI_1695 [Shewanella violacea DSS12]
MNQAKSPAHWLAREEINSYQACLDLKIRFQD